MEPSSTHPGPRLIGALEGTGNGHAGNGSWLELVNKAATILILLLLAASVGQQYQAFVWVLALGVVGMARLSALPACPWLVSNAGNR